MYARSTPASISLATSRIKRHQHGAPYPMTPLPTTVHEHDPGCSEQIMRRIYPYSVVLVSERSGCTNQKSRMGVSVLGLGLYQSVRSASKTYCGWRFSGGLVFVPCGFCGTAAWLGFVRFPEKLSGCDVDPRPPQDPDPCLLEVQCARSNAS